MRDVLSRSPRLVGLVQPILLSAPFVTRSTEESSLQKGGRGVETHCTGRCRLERFEFTMLFASLIVFDIDHSFMTLMRRFIAFIVFEGGAR